MPRQADTPWRLILIKSFPHLFSVSLFAFVASLFPSVQIASARRVNRAIEHYRRFGPKTQLNLGCPRPPKSRDEQPVLWESAEEVVLRQMLLV